MTARNASAEHVRHEALDSIGDPWLHLYDRSRRDDSPELRLFAALLEDARFCLAPSSLVDRATRAAAAAWVRGEVASVAPCSFPEVCAIVGLDEEATRARLLALARGETPERRRRLEGLARVRRDESAHRLLA